MHRSTPMFDGDCAFCSRCAGVARRILPSECEVTPWQRIDLDAMGFTAERAQSEVLWISENGEVVGGATAVARALRAAGGFWAVLGLLLSMPPVSWVAPPVYRLVAANRYRLPGGTAACRVPSRPTAPEVDAA